MNAEETSRACYAMAYSVLPQYVFEDPDKLVELLSTGRMGAVFFYFMTCKLSDQEPDETDADTINAFAAHTGRLDDEHDYYLVEYPPPVPVDLSEELEKASPDQMLEAMKGIVLAPYFSGMVRHTRTHATRYFVLGQSLEGRTTFRTVTPEMNANLGPGCEPELETFLGLLRNRVRGDDEEPRAAVMFGKAASKRWWQFWN